MGLLPIGLHAQLYWDTNGSTAGAATSGVADGTWDTTTANWTTDANGEITTTTFTAGDAVIFSAGTDVTSASITISGTPSVGALTIEEGNYSFSGSMALGTSTLNVAASASAAFATTVTFSNTTMNVDGDLEIRLQGTGGVLTKSGTGTLTLKDSASSDYFINITTGTVVLQRTSTKQLKAVTIGNGTTMRLAASNQLASGVTANGSFELDAGVSDVITTLSGSDSITGGAGSSLGVTGGTFTGTISGDLDIVKSGTGTHTFSGTSTSTGDITVSAGTYALSSTGSLTFTIGANGVNNAILGTGIATLAGTLNFDLTGADLTNGNSWLIVDVGSLASGAGSFASTFTVTDFSETGLDSGIWANGSGFTFDESTGILSYAAIPEPSAFGLLAGLGVLLTTIRRRRPMV